MTIQDQLRSLTPPTSLDSDWDDVVARANRRARKQHFQSRAAIGLFVVVVAAGALLFPSSGVDTIDAPAAGITAELDRLETCLLYTSPSPRDQRGSRMPSSA